MFAEMQVLFLWQAGFEKMEVTGRFELPEELLDLERSGLLESAAFDRSRARRAVSTAPSPLLGPQDPLRTTSAQGGYSLYDESSRCVCILPSMLCCLRTLLSSLHAAAAPPGFAAMFHMLSLTSTCCLGLQLQIVQIAILVNASYWLVPESDVLLWQWCSAQVNK